MKHKPMFPLHVCVCVLCTGTLNDNHRKFILVQHLYVFLARLVCVSDLLANIQYLTIERTTKTHVRMKSKNCKIISTCLFISYC